MEHSVYFASYILFLFYFIYLFIYYLWPCWVFVSVRGLSLVAASGGHSSSRCAGLSLSRPLVAEHGLQTRRLSNCGSWAQLLYGMWDPPRPGLEPASPALAGRFSTTAPPGKPKFTVFLKRQSYTHWVTIIKKPDNPSVDEDVEKLEHLYTVGGT